MHIAVVIPALNEAERIAAAVASAQSPEVEVWVVDGGSSDGTPERARRAGARVVASPMGRADQMNTGLENASGDAVLFLHADSRLPRGYAAAMRQCLSEPEVVGGAFDLQFDDRSLLFRAIEWGVRLRVAVVGLPYGDQAIFARRTALAAIGGVPRAPILEDLDLVKALRREGRFLRIPLAVVTSARRYRSGGILRTWLRNSGALLAWSFGLERGRIAGWYRR